LEGQADKEGKKAAFTGKEDGSISIFGYKQIASGLDWQPDISGYLNSKDWGVNSYSLTSIDSLANHIHFLTSFNKVS
jgi:hypothetical protein